MCVTLNKGLIISAKGFFSQSLFFFCLPKFFICVLDVPFPNHYEPINNNMNDINSRKRVWKLEHFNLIVVSQAYNVAFLT